MEQSILNTIKSLLGINKTITSFDEELIVHINTVFMILNQLGASTKGYFSIEDKNAFWSDYIPEEADLEAIKTFMHLKVRLVFDPPTSSAVIAAYEKVVSELEWRLCDTATNLTQEGEN